MVKNKVERKITNDSIKLFEKGYKINNDKGIILSNIIEFIKNSTSKNKDILISLILSEDKELDKKSNMMQKVIINKVLISELLNIKHKNNSINIANIIVHCNSLNKDDYWFAVVTKEVIPFILNNL